LYDFWIALKVKDVFFSGPVWSARRTINLLYSDELKGDSGTQRGVDVGVIAQLPCSVVCRS